MGVFREWIGSSEVPKEAVQDYIDGPPDFESVAKLRTAVRTARQKAAKSNGEAVVYFDTGGGVYHWPLQAAANVVSEESKKSGPGVKIKIFSKRGVDEIKSVLSIKPDGSGENLSAAVKDFAASHGDKSYAVLVTNRAGAGPSLVAKDKGIEVVNMN